jgi:hypothetical protein
MVGSAAATRAAEHGPVRWWRRLGSAHTGVAYRASSRRRTSRLRGRRTIRARGCCRWSRAPAPQPILSHHHQQPSASRLAPAGQTAMRDRRWTPRKGFVAWTAASSSSFLCRPGIDGRPVVHSRFPRDEARRHLHVSRLGTHLPPRLYSSCTCTCTGWCSECTIYTTCEQI